MNRKENEVEKVSSSGSRINMIVSSLKLRKETRIGATWGIGVAVIAAIFISGYFLRPGFPGIFNNLSGTVLFLVLNTAILFLILFVMKLIRALPEILGFAGLALLILFYFSIRGMIFAASSRQLLFLMLAIGLSAMLLGGSLASLLSRQFKTRNIPKKILVFSFVIIPLIVIGYFVSLALNPGSNAHLTKAVKRVPPLRKLTAPNPSHKGSYEVLSLTYGSGSDKRRPEFADGVGLKTSAVDASKIVRSRIPFLVKLRNQFWGFDAHAFPLNGRVWYPSGKGPFPLVLVLHGNHRMQEFSDPGYAWLGALLASRGFICVSLDQNFLNSETFFFGSLGNDTAARAWMLLEHLKVWQKWNTEAGNPFFGKINMKSIGIMGHSRGGEAVGIAAVFNKLPRYPENPQVLFDYGFRIKAIVAIAPRDQQYRPGGKPARIQNTSYLVIQGAHDADVTEFEGIRQFNRIQFTDKGPWLKAAIYSYRSNHGQFNTIWGNNDWDKPYDIVLNKKPLLAGEDQRKWAKVFISGFLELTLHGDESYRDLFRDYRTAGDWLPEDIYITRYQDASFKCVCDFEEDADVTTGSVSGVTCLAERTSLWREEVLRFRKGKSRENRVVMLGWSGDVSEHDGGNTPRYSIVLAETEDLKNLTEEALLVFSVAESNQRIMRSRRSNLRDKSNEPLDFTVELQDETGNIAAVPVSSVQRIPPLIHSRYTKFSSEKHFAGKSSDPALQTLEMPVALFRKNNPQFDHTSVKVIRFVFDRGRQGTVLLDNIGFRSNVLEN